MFHSRKRDSDLCSACRVERVQPIGEAPLTMFVDVTPQFQRQCTDGNICVTIALLSQLIELPGELVTPLKRQADARGLTLEAWIYELARAKAQAAAAKILEIQKRVKPDPEGWTISDYINYGRP